MHRMSTSSLQSPRLLGEKIARPEYFGFKPESVVPAIGLFAVHPRFRGISASHASSTKPPPRRVSSSLPCFSLPSHYDALGVQVGASREEIKAAYRKLVRAVHPDVVNNDRKDESADEFIRIHAAYTTLSDPEKRADYDREVFLVPYRRSSSFSGYSRRTLETDQCW